VNVGEASLARRSKAKEAVPRPPLTYKEALAWLYSLQRFGIKLGLENIQRLIEFVASASCRSVAGWKPAPRVIHVAGTNGKGSVCAMIDSICRAQGYRTGLFTSPHLVTFRERIRVNGDMISEDAVADGLTTIRNLVANWDPHPTFFEVVTALALKHFSDTRVDIAILETGLGGRLDATNAIQSNVSLITAIDFDHEKWLGNTISEIAAEKAGIIKSKVPVVCAPQRPEAEEVILARAAECQAPLEFVTEPYDETPIALAGLHQKQNAALAIAAICTAKMDVDSSAIARGLACIEWPARFQRWDEGTLIDGAHNPAAARLVAQTWSEIFGDQRGTVILAILADKNLRAICEALAPISELVLLPKIRSERATDPEKLAKVLANITPPLPYSIVPSISEALALAQAKPNPVLITGSLHFAGEVLAHLRGKPAAFEECMQ
jgi:dihydrofolate synthase / folylpolyglutamate synthase